MLYVLSFIVAGVFVISAYRQGLKDGVNLANGKKPEKILPAKGKATKRNETEDRIAKGLANILDYGNRRMKKGGESN